ncbi:MAG TPA: GNAT family N-acetyltransferase [Rhodocyclaceae bacterium]|nr:GNAT family N-acetyltransferase [Rhodocyclaceae bacterium]
MLRFIQLIFLTIIAAFADSPAEAIGNERWRAHGLNRSLDASAATWDRLNQRLMAGHPMLDSRFIDAMLRHFGDSSERLCQLERDGEVVGMCILRRAKPGVWATFLPSQTQLGPAILADPADLAGLPTQLPGLAGQVDLLCQDPDFSPAFQCTGIPCQTKTHALTMSIRLEGDFDTYWSDRPKNLRASMRKRENRLSKGELQPRVVRIDQASAMSAAVERFGALESAGWKGRAGTAVSSDNAQGPFYRDLMEAFAATGQAVAYEYWLGERLAASQLAITSGTMMVLLKTTYDEELASFSPGRLLLREVIADAFQRLPGGVIEFYTNADADQLAWATDQRWIEHISLYRNQLVERLATAFRTTRRFAQGFGHGPETRAAASAQEG